MKYSDQLDPESRLFFYFEDNEANVCCTYVLKGVRRERRKPVGKSHLGWRRVAAVEDDETVFVAADAVAPTEHVNSSRPAMSVQGSGLAGMDNRVEHANAVVLEEELVVFGCGGQGIEF